MISPSIYLVTGANRGIGKGLVAAYIARSHTIVIGGVRDLSAAGSKALHALPTGNGSKLILITLNSSSETDPVAAVETLSSRGITKIDVLIANAGISHSYDPVATLRLEDLKEHVTVNAYGPILLFQAFWPLLQKSTRPKFVVISTVSATIGAMETLPYHLGSYGGSKALINHLTRRIHFENENLIAFPIHPGFVQTEMGNTGAKAFGMAEAPNNLVESIGGVVDKIDTATREKTSGRFMSFDGTPMVWLLGSPEMGILPHEMVHGLFEFTSLQRSTLKRAEFRPCWDDLIEDAVRAKP